MELLFNSHVTGLKIFHPSSDERQAHIHVYAFLTVRIRINLIFGKKQPSDCLSAKLLQNKIFLLGIYVRAVQLLALVSGIFLCFKKVTSVSYTKKKRLQGVYMCFNEEVSSFTLIQYHFSVHIYATAVTVNFRMIQFISALWKFINQFILIWTRLWCKVSEKISDM